MRIALAVAALLPWPGAALAQTTPLGPSGSAIGSVSVAPAAPGFTNQQASAVPQRAISNPGGLSLSGSASGAFPSISSQTGSILNAGGLSFGSGVSLGRLPTPAGTGLSIGATGNVGSFSGGLGTSPLGSSGGLGLSTGTASAGIGATGSTGLGIGTTNGLSTFGLGLTTSTTTRGLVPTTGLGTGGAGGGGGSGAGIATGVTVDPARQTLPAASGGGGGGSGAGISGAPASAANDPCATTMAGACMSNGGVF